MPAAISSHKAFACLSAILLAASLAMAAPCPAMAQDDDADIAVGGADPVSLRDGERAVPGRVEIATHWKGSDWLFTSEANRQAFEANPRAYAPAMGGYCPVAMAQGRKQRGDPNQFVVVGDKLYLTGGNSARHALEANADAILPQAQANWKRMSR